MTKTKRYRGDPDKKTRYIVATANGKADVMTGAELHDLYCAGEPRRYYNYCTVKNAIAGVRSEGWRVKKY